ncbi:MAG TPA: DUF599 domain-containing protein [Azospira sp.]|nr:DUF599 domain-containing protein [Azospira sp.]
MLKSPLAHLTPLDWSALVWFLACWVGYAVFAERGLHASNSLVGQGHAYRLLWARRLMEREVRITDASLIGNLMGSVSFYANTTIYIIAGLFAVLGTLDKVVSVAADFPFAREVSRDLLELKLLLLFGIFVVAYFKFTWSLRQFNLLSILVGGAPLGSCTTNPDMETYAQKMAAVNSYAGDDFNRGIRAYYFGLAALTWLVSPNLFLVVTTAITVVLYRRDYASPTLQAMR